MPPCRFSDLPIDTMLEVMQHLAISDLVHLLLTCSSIYSLSQERSFWISLLETTRAVCPIGCPKYAELSQYDLQNLKDLVASRFKLQTNWNRSFPEVVDLHLTSLDERVDIVCLVQGTDIVLLHMRETGHVVCWDSKLAAPFPFQPIKTGGQLNDVSAPSESTHGVCSFVVLAKGDTSRRTVWRYIITIKHENRKATGFESVCTEIADPICHFESIFLTQDVVGAVIVEELGDHCTITTSKVGDGAGGKESVNHMKLNYPISERHLMVAFTYKGHLYNILEDGVTAQIQHISRKNLTSGRCDEPSSVYKADILNVGETSFPLYYILPSCASYGVAAAFVRIIDDDDEAGDGSVPAITFTFLPTTRVGDDSDDSDVSSPLTFPLPCPTARVPGRLTSPSLLWMDHGGFNIVAILDDIDSNNTDILPTLVLVRYHPSTQSTSVHYPGISPSLDLYAVTNVCVDDTAGVVYLTGVVEESKWSLCTLSYV
ncbi:hypothetical protein FB45DRAFT_894563 [Roridomyces roridus]|uniref:F-box domain-containing protein n=1 Tax=Roridomyces roridus TaxID=1738132 RepID=A0AAD7FZM6_9AGAR|nr:hypothetical protein FB45DRAFT_894563 [Roridomyces roridus]